MDDRDLGFGRCARCEKWAVVGLQDVKLCQEHFDAALAIVFSRLQKGASA